MAFFRNWQQPHQQTMQQKPTQRPQQRQQPRQQQRPQQQQQQQPNPFSQPLPDGVTMEPLNAETFRHMQQFGNPPPMSALPPVVAPIVAPVGSDAPPDASPSAPEVSLQHFMDSEHNGALFYAHLANMAPAPAQVAHLHGLSHRCTQRKDAYGAFSPTLEQRHEKSTPNFTHISFDSGVHLAVQEENQLLQQLLDALETPLEPKMTTLLTNQVHRKIGDLCLLQSLRSFTAEAADRRRSSDNWT